MEIKGKLTATTVNLEALTASLPLKLTAGKDAVAQAIDLSTSEVTSILPLAKGGTGANLVDPNADRVLFWDDSAGAMTWLTLGSNLSITGTTANASGSVSSIDITQPAAGITATGGPITSSGAITLALADDLAALEALSGTGIVRRTGSNTWSTGTTVSVAEGGTGLTSLGSPLQQLRVNAGGSALEYFTASAGSSYTFLEALSENAGIVKINNRRDIEYITQPTTGSALISGWTAVGAPSYTVVNGEWLFSGAGSGGYTQYIRNDLGVLSENSRIEATIVPTTITATDSGIEIGWQSYNPNSGGIYAHSVRGGWVSHQGSADYGKAIITGSANSYSSVSTTSNTSVSANDEIKLILVRSGLRYTITVTNLTQGWSVSNSQEATPVSVTLSPNNSAYAVVYHKGGAWTVKDFKYIVEAPVVTDLHINGDSITFGQGASTAATRWASKVGSQQNNILAGGGADTTQSILTRIDEIIAINPKRVLLMIGGNDILFAVPTLTWQSNYTSIRDQLAAAGIEVIHCLPTPRTATDVSALRTYILANFQMDRIIDTWTPLLGSGTSLLAKYNLDNTHPNESGHAQIAATVNDNLNYLHGSILSINKNLTAKNGYLEGTDSGLGADQFVAGAIIARESGSLTRYLQIGHIAGYGYIQAITQLVGGNNLVLSPAYNSRVGIGEISPDAILDVKNNISGNQVVIIMNHNNTAAAGEESRFDLQYAGTTRARVANFVGAGADFGLKLYTTLTTSLNTTPNIWMAGSGNNGFFITSAPTALVHAGASTTAAASLRIPTGTAPTSPNEGDIWRASNFIKTYNGSATRRIAVSDDTTPTNGQLLIGNGTDYTVASITSTGTTITVTPGSGTLNLEVAQTLASGTWTPTLTNVANTDAIVPHDGQYMRVGSVVTGSFRLEVEATTETLLTEVSFTLPVASNFAQPEQLSGSGGLLNYPTAVKLFADTTTNLGIVSFNTPTDGPPNLDIYVHFTYQII